MSILIDPRAGSGPRTVTRTSPFTGEKHTRRYMGLNEFPPLNLCVECGQECTPRDNPTKPVCTCSAATPFSALSPLDAGDVAFTGNGPSGNITVGVEVKSLSDLLTSIEDGRLRARQIPDMIAAFDVRWLLYYGSYRCCPATGNLQVPSRRDPHSGRCAWEDYKFGGRSSKRVVPYAYLESFLASPSLTNTRIHVKHCYDLAECARWIGVLHHIWQKPYSAHSSMLAFDTSADLGLMPLLSPSLKQRARTIATFPGVSYQRAVAIARAFTSLRALFNCTEEELAEVQIPAKDGSKGKARRLGKVLAKSILGLITREG